MITKPNIPINTFDHAEFIDSLEFTSSSGLTGSLLMTQLYENDTISAALIFD